MAEKKRIAIIDDDPDILFILKQALESAGYETRGSTDGEDVTDIVNDFHPHIMLLDFVISGIDGSVVCKWLKGQEASKHIPIIMMSAHPEADETAKDAGADAVIAKPFELQTLLDTVARFIQFHP
jgi:DNA-binding response OmpR family regulator